MSNTVEHSHKAASFTVENSALEDSSSVQDSEKQAQGGNVSGQENGKARIDAAAEKALLWKLDSRLIPLLFILCKSFLHILKLNGLKHLLTCRRSDELYGPFECWVGVGSFVVPNIR